MQTENRVCQNCKNDFTIESDDFLFYEKIKVPAPTFCPDCRRQRRFSFRNTHALYKRKESHDGKEVLSIFSPDKDLVVYEQKYWWSDAWDPMSYGREYDFTKPFFQQWKELRDGFPLLNLSNSKSVNSDYCNVAEENYDCYLVTACFRNERVMYSDSTTYLKDCMDVHVMHKSEFSYDDTNCSDSYKLFYSEDSHSCTDSYFLYDCKGCTNCFMSANLRNKSYCFQNVQLSKEEYAKNIAQYNLGDFTEIQKLKNEFKEMKSKVIHRYAHILNSYNVTGDNISHAKNARFCFDVTDGPEDSKFMFWAAINIKDCYDTDAAGGGLETAYESFDVGVGGSNNLFTNIVYSSSNVTYSVNCYSSSNLFGCIGLRSKSYCILNKQYTKEEYEELLPKILKHMNEMPYIDKAGLVYKYGEFFPAELSLFGYNETVASDYTPLSKEEVLQRGLSWKDPEEKTYKIDLESAMLPSDIRDVTDEILEKVISCAHKGECNDRCTTAFKILPNELTFYRRFNIPLPRLCSWCRHYQRFRTRKPLKLWHRSCMCDKENHGHSGVCSNEFETAYSPEQPEVVYCESCYQKEVI